jgi:flagellar hook-length control protein FliK
VFAQDLAAAARSSQRSLAVKSAATQSKHTTPAPKASSTAKSSAPSKPKPARDPSDSTDKPSSSVNSEQSRAADRSDAQPKAQASASAQAAPDTAAQAAERNAAGNSTGVAKGRALSRAVTKTGISPSATPNTTGDAIDDPSVDTSNQSGLSLLQLLAQSLQSDDSTVSPTDTDGSAPVATNDTAGNTTGPDSNDPNAIALAMFTQALAAALGASAASQQTPISNAVRPASSDAAAGITDATDSPNSSAPMQDVMSVLAQTIAADAKSNSDASAAQPSVDPTKGNASDTSTSDTAAAGPNSLAHLGIASHFSTQHARTDASVGDLKSPVGSSAWDDELGTQLTWMTQKGLETGSLRVSPEHLGPVEVNISVQNGDASVWFGATHPDTRTALEQALPRLREMFANQGMNLTDAGVSRESLTRHGSRDQSRSSASQALSGVSAVGSIDAGTTAAIRINLGLVDTYA